MHQNPERRVNAGMQRIPVHQLIRRKKASCLLALGVGIGVDYGIHIYNRFRGILADGKSIPEAYRITLAISGNGVVFTGLTLAMGVATWFFSPLKFQADMGILLTFMFLVNILGAILLLPALASWLLRSRFAS